MKEQRKTISVKVSPKFAEEVRDYAFEHKMNLSELLRQALKTCYGLEEKKEDE